MATTRLFAKHLQENGLSGCVKLDFSGSNLYDEDFDLLSTAICDVQSKTNKKCDFTINLNNTRIAGADPELTQTLSKLLALENLQYLVMTHTPFASTDAIKYWNKLGANSDALKKIIWIPEMWIEAGNWKHFLSSQDAVEQVKKTHHMFYNPPSSSVKQLDRQIRNQNFLTIFNELIMYVEFTGSGV
eukprot:CAMPEP_0201550748 /NCGR_PEP_ID=MMETSP0173_2-20130828/7056_1 /ASSEMBLY_ACC=CAM_ASM_000268 /TAXON_ID=218659 /ORGANISM="Vexillifera sp., Strain DIVA3 564/2" /LENGTH=186 /DNA_ID=CAMNT_0047960815 /DNA_START=290 /DNA_END=851 /DNA_ORIENTATION=-